MFPKIGFGRLYQISSGDKLSSLLGLSLSHTHTRAHTHRFYCL